MTDKESYFALREISSGKFVQWVTKTGRVRLVKNPFNANYFLEYQYCRLWQKENGLSNDHYEVIEFEKSEG